MIEYDLKYISPTDFEIEFKQRDNKVNLSFGIAKALEKFKASGGVMQDEIEFSDDWSKKTFAVAIRGKMDELNRLIRREDKIKFFSWQVDKAIIKKQPHGLYTVQWFITGTYTEI